MAITTVEGIVYKYMAIGTCLEAPHMAMPHKCPQLRSILALFQAMTKEMCFHFVVKLLTVWITAQGSLEVQSHRRLPTTRARPNLRLPSHY